MWLLKQTISNNPNLIFFFLFLFLLTPFCKWNKDDDGRLPLIFRGDVISIPGGSHNNQAPRERSSILYKYF